MTRPDSSQGLAPSPEREGADRLVSVIVPCYNQGTFLGQALSSVSAQDHAPLETIVVDDGSSDDTSAVAAAFPAVRLIRQRNAGTAAARNRGLRASRGVYVLFLDADDRLLPGAIEAGVACLERNADCGLAWGRVRVVGSGGEPIAEPEDGPSDSEDGYLALLRHNFIWSPGAVLYRREAVEAVGGFRSFAGGSADLDLNLRIAARWRLCGHGRRVLEYRDHGDSQSADAALMLRSSVAVRRRHRRLVRGKPEHEKALNDGIEEQRSHYGRRLLACVSSDLRGGRWAAVARGFLVLLRYDRAHAAAALRGGR